MCSAKTMIGFAIAIGLTLMAGYEAFPQYQAVITVVAPYLLVLACPLAMYYGMSVSKKQEKQKTSKPKGK